MKSIFCFISLSIIMCFSIAKAHNLYVLSDTKVQILNILPKFTQGIELDSGLYKIQFENKTAEIPLNDNSVVMTKSLHNTLLDNQFTFVGRSNFNLLVVTNLKSKSASAINTFVKENDLFQWASINDLDVFYKFNKCIDEVCLYVQTDMPKRLLACNHHQEESNCNTVMLKSDNKIVPIKFNDWVIPNFQAVLKSRFKSFR